MLATNPLLACYELKKQALIADLHRLNATQQPIRLRKKTSNLFRHRSEPSQGIDVSQFNQVIDISRENLIAKVEGMTTYDTLVLACLKHHCLPAVVPELKTITVGGALTGCGIESSSFKYGLMHETVVEMEVLLSNGQVVVCTPDNEYKDLFFGFPNSYGTLGYALCVSVKLYPVLPYVKLTHTHFIEPRDCFKTLSELCLTSRHEESMRFIEGVYFDKQDLYITTAELVQDAPFLSDYKGEAIYYQSIKQRREDYLSIHDYIWRWDTDWFWCSKFFYVQNPIVRALVGKKRLNSATYGRIRKWVANNRLARWVYGLFTSASESVIQDVQIPIEKAPEFLAFFEETIGIKPIWLCPTMPYRAGVQFDLYPMNPSNLYVNFGFWDVKPTQENDGYYNRLIEKEVRELSGKKSLYSTVFYNENEFWELYDKKSYDKLKKKYDHSGRLLSLYEKCTEK